MRKIKLLLMLAAMSMSVVMQAMQIFVNVPGQGKKTIDVEPSDSFANVKSKIFDETGIDPANQSLFFCGRLLLDTETLQDRSIQKENTLNLVIATVNTSVYTDLVLHIGDKFSLSENTSFNSKSFVAAYNPYTLVRGNIDDSDYYHWIVTEAADGAYYIFKDADGDLYSTQTKMAVTSSTDGVVVGDYIDVMGVYNYQLTPHQHVDEFADNVDGIEAGLEALVGQTVKLAINRNFIMDGYFNTICLPISLDDDAIAAHPWLAWSEIFEFESAAVNGGSLDLYINQVHAIEAGKPYLIRWAEDPFDPIIPGLYFEGVTIAASEGVAVGTGVQFVGSMGRTQLENGNENYLFVGENNTLYWPNSDNKLKGFRAYFKVSGDVAQHGAPARMVIRKTPTGVENVQDAAHSAQKVLRDGQLIILRNGVEYNAQGQIVK